MGDPGDIFYVGEGLSSSVAVSRWRGDRLLYHNAGKVQASSVTRDMRLQRMLGHFTTLTPKEPKKVLVIGCGSGATAGAVSIDPAVEHLVIAEIEPLVPRVVSEHFGEHNFNVVKNPKTKVVIDDARHYLLTTHEKFDAITSDPLDSWVKGAAMLYTKEFFELAKSKLNPGGTVTVWVNINESTSGRQKRDRIILRGVPTRDHLGQHTQRPRIRHRLVGHSRTPALQCGRMASQVGPAGICRHEEIAPGSRHLFRG